MKSQPKVSCSVSVLISFRFSAGKSNNNCKANNGNLTVGLFVQASLKPFELTFHLLHYSLLMLSPLSQSLRSGSLRTAYLVQRHELLYNSLTAAAHHVVGFFPSLLALWMRSTEVGNSYVRTRFTVFFFFSSSAPVIPSCSHIRNNKET